MIARLAIVAYAIACATYAPAWHMHCQLVHAAQRAIGVQ